MHKLLFLVSLFFLSNITLASPSVHEAILSKNGLEIKGRSFGDENPMVFWDDAESTADMQVGDAVRIGPDEMWRTKPGSSWEPFKLQRSFATKTRKMGAFYEGVGRRVFVGNPNHPKNESMKNTIFVSWWYKPSLSPRSDGGSNKFIRIWDDKNGKGTRISWTQMHFTCNQFVTWGSWQGNVNDWNHHAILVDLEREVVKTWVNGVLIHNAPCKKHSDFPDLPLYVGLIGFDHSAESYDKMITAIDDIYIGSSQARVEISENKTWSQTMPKEVLPIIEWSDNKIKASLHDGIIRQSNSMYVYVIDANGNVNTKGIKVSCIDCPKPQMTAP